jgi:hypothetical protein
MKITSVFAKGEKNKAEWKDSAFFIAIKMKTNPAKVLAGLTN